MTLALASASCSLVARSLVARSLVPRGVSVKRALDCRHEKNRVCMLCDKT